MCYSELKKKIVCPVCMQALAGACMLGNGKKKGDVRCMRWKHQRMHHEGDFKVKKKEDILTWPACMQTCVCMHACTCKAKGFFFFKNN